ncbi:MAG: hypothetical protein H5T86_12825, partial [Armatimonadetes bacterium]|nr:hypothetical protein [Armatimonadota bacterium]
NRVWVLVSDPTGKPAKARVMVSRVEADAPWAVDWQRQIVETDDLGIAEVSILPRLSTSGAGARPSARFPREPFAALPPRLRGIDEEEEAEYRPVRLELVARTATGARARATMGLAAEESVDGESLLLRVDRVIAKVGQTIVATAVSPVPRGYVYFDVIKSRQTMLTQAADLIGGRATTRLSLTPELAGTLLVSAYRITGMGNVVRDTIPVVVQPADDLQISVKPDRETYRPGEDAKVELAVHTRDGKPAVAALGVSVVDESVFALQEMQPGMEKVYAYLEEELRKPRYEVHGMELPVIIAQPRPTPAPEQERAAKVMLAAVDLPKVDFQVADSYAQRVNEAKPEWAKKLMPKLNLVVRAVDKYNRAHPDQPLRADAAAETLIRAGLLKPDDIKDLWGRDMRIVSAYGSPEIDEPMLISAGPDGQFGTLDDVEIEPPRRRGPVFMLGAGLPEDAVRAAGVPKAAVGGMGAGRDHEAGPAAAEPVRIRQFFPETLLFKPDLITDTAGRATLSFKMADSITTWRLSALANSTGGLLGSTDAPLRCFQDFFVDIDLPVSLTQDDEISLPVAVYNYLKEPQDVTLTLEKNDWFELRGEAEQRLTLQPNEVTVRHFPIRVTKLGDHTLTVVARGTKMSDAIRRSVRVVPNGKPVEVTASGRLRGQVEATIEIPARAIAGATGLIVKVYPGIFSQAVEGLDSILRMPFGCFEQTTSVTYPNVLVLDYMRSTHQISPEIQMKAEGYINLGYQRLLSYEVQGGGFSWFGDPPANKLLTALGLMEFYDMNKVYPIDEGVITRTQSWLLQQQEADGSWKPDKEYLHQEAWERLQNSSL